MPREGYLYLACPYSHPNPVVRERRFNDVTVAAVHLMNQGHIVYSPITHSHPMATMAELPGDWSFWERYDREFLRHAYAFAVLTLLGWQESKGIRAEMGIAIDLGIPVFDVDPNTYEMSPWTIENS